MKNNTHNLSEIFAQRITELRREKHMTQAEVAEKIGMKRAVVAYYESSAKNPTVNTVHKFADFFGVSVNELLENRSDEKKSPGPTPKLKRQMNKIRNLSPARQKMISKAIDVLIEG